MFRATKGNFYCLVPLVIVYDGVFVIPILLEIFLGIPETPYKNFRYALRDQETLLIFLLFIVCSQIVFLLEVRKLKRKIKKETKRNDYDGLKSTLDVISKFKYKNVIRLVCYALFFIVVIRIIGAPDPSYYLHLQNVGTTLTSGVSDYQRGMRTLGDFLGVAILVLKLFDDKNSVSDLTVRVFFVITLLMVNQKRTWLLVIVGACFLIDYLRGLRKSWFISKYIIIIGLTAFYFVAYSYVTGKIYYNDDWYYVLNEYFFRSMHLRFSIYAVLHPNQIHILDYPGQSILFSLFFWIPRTLWPNKPWPYMYYYISGVLGYSSLNYDQIGWGMPPSYYPEFVSNFGLFGLPLSIMFTIWMARFFDKRESLCKLLGISLITILEVYYYDDMMKILALLILFLCLKERTFRMKGHLYFRVKHKNKYYT